MKTFKVTGSRTEEVEVQAEDRLDAVRRVKSKHGTDFRVEEVEDVEGQQYHGVFAICDACCYPIFDDEKDVGIECNLHERCVPD